MMVNNYGYSQYMINGDFENYVYIGDPLGIEISNIPGWQTIAGSCDVKHPSNQTSISGIPHTGDGCGRFFAAAQAADEFCSGTTQTLTAGNTYTISFWVRAVRYSGAPAKSMAVAISSFLPTVQLSPSFNANVTPIIELVPTANYEQISFCYTPDVNGAHYITFGPWYGYGNSDVDKSIEFNIDDVEVSLLDPSIPLPLASLTIPQTTYCVGDNVIVDGSTSNNETSYIWEVYELVNSSGEQFVYSSGQLIGQASSFDASSVINSPEPGACYRVYLTALGTCINESFIDFCYEDPNINFYGTNFLCEGVPTDLTVTGDNGWTYTWSTGQSGVGLKTIQVTPTGNSATYSVNVVTVPLGCSATQSITFNVFSSNNVAPWMNGINGSGEYTIYVNQGDVVNFNSTIFNDSPNESLLNSVSNYQQWPFLNISFPSNDIGNMNFYWNTGFGLAPNVAPGVYQFTFTLDDVNPCNNIEPSYFTFTIVIICDQCPMCVYYEDRGPTPQTPLPAETKAGKCIVAGFSQPVSTGGTSVLFQAGVSIDLGTFFTAEPGFVAQIDPTTCVTDCEDCCTDWAGFTMDEIPNGYYMNFDDSDPTNDIFQVTDINHPFCAFSAKGYELSILDNWGDIMAESSFSTSSCCPFDSPAPENPVSHSSIWWDGFTENIFGNQVHPNDGTYFYYLTLYGCNGEEAEYQGFIYIMSSGKMATPSDTTKMTAEQIASIESINRLIEEISLAPNPASSEIQIIGIENGKKIKVQLFDDKGIMLEKDLQLKNGQFDVSKLNPGTYFCKIFMDGTLISKKFVKI